MTQAVNRSPSSKLARLVIFAFAVCVGLVLLTLRTLVPGVGFTWESPPPRGGDFTLSSLEGPVSTRDFRGKTLLIYFGYTSCPDVCPTTLADVGQALSSLPPETRERAAGLFVSVDPERDTAARIKDYASYFSPRIVGVTGSQDQLRKAIALYGGSFAKRPLPEGEGYAVDHPGSVYLLDPQGNYYARAAHGTRIEGFVKLIQDSLAGRPPPADGEPACQDCL